VSGFPDRDVSAAPHLRREEAAWSHALAGSTAAKEPQCQATMRAHETEQSLKREALEAPTQQIGNVGLADSHPLGCSLLSEPGLLDHCVDAHDEPSLEGVLVRIGQAEVGKDVAAAAGNGCMLHGDLSHRDRGHPVRFTTYVTL
jgi:hypothetical protein